jgi:hypothetical protein
MIICFVCATTGYSDVIYKSQDKNGNPIFSDRKPDSRYQIIEKGNYRSSKQIAAPTDIPEERSLDTIRGKTNEIKGDIDALYNGLLAIDQSTQGTVTVNFVIGQDGRVGECAEDESAMSGGTFKGTICAAIQTINYEPVVSEQPKKVTYTYQFKPRTTTP